MASIIYNVLIGGVSIGMTFNRTKAESWVNKSMYQGSKQIVEVPYKEPHDISVRVAYD